MGFSSITSYAYSTEVCQGNTANADDVEAFYSNLSSKRYAVTAKGYSDKRFLREVLYDEVIFALYLNNYSFIDCVF